MAQEYQYVCDGCGKVVHGKVKNAFVHRDYIQIRGSLVLQLMDQKTRWRDHVFLTKPPAEELVFCLEPGLPCLEGYIEIKREAYEARRLRQLREQASTDALRRLDETI